MQERIMKNSSEKRKKRYWANRSSELKNQRMYQKNNKKIIKERRQAIKEITAIKGKKYRDAHKEIEAARSKRYYENNQEKVKKYLKVNKVIIAKKHKEYVKNNRDRHNILEQRRQAKKKQLLHTLTCIQWENIKLHFDNRCAYCGKESPLQQEHFLALSKNGEYTLNNIIPSCKYCNNSKKAKNFFEWYPKYKYHSKKREKVILSFLGYKNGMQQLKII